MMQKQFKHPFFVSPHAVIRFQERVANIPAGQVIIIIQSALQDHGLPIQVEYRDSQICPIFRARYRDKTYYIPVAKGEGAWPAVPTIYGEESELHGKYLRGTLNHAYKAKNRR